MVLIIILSFCAFFLPFPSMSIYSFSIIFLKPKLVRFQNSSRDYTRDKQRETKKSRRLNQTKTSYARKRIQIYLKKKNNRPKNTYHKGKNKVENKE